MQRKTPALFGTSCCSTLRTLRYVQDCVYDSVEFSAAFTCGEEPV